MCETLEKQEFAVEGSHNCWIKDFKEYARNQGKDFPVSASEFDEFILKWTTEDLTGKTQKSVKNVGFVDGKLIFS